VPKYHSDDARYKTSSGVIGCKRISLLIIGDGETIDVEGRSQTAQNTEIGLAYFYALLSRRKHLT
jgi:hypothetical protein